VRETLTTCTVEGLKFVCSLKLRNLQIPCVQIAIELCIWRMLVISPKVRSSRDSSVPLDDISSTLGFSI
jgi:hypothetical protein